MVKQVKKEVKKKQRKEPFGRPTLFTQKLADEICEKLSVHSGSFEKLVEQNEHWPNYKTIYKWMQKNENFRDAYRRAKEEQCETLENSLLDIAFNESNDFYFNGKLTVANSVKVSRDQLKISTIQKILSYRHERYRNNAQIKVEGSLMTATGLTTNELKNNARALLKECSKTKA